MKILEVNCNDLPGNIFNGYDLHLALNKSGHCARQMVHKKYSNCDTVSSFAKDDILSCQLIEWEQEHSVSNVIMPYGRELEKSKEFQEAEIVHYHILHNHAISLLDYARLMNQKCSVWTIHDPWILTGNCIHPMECNKWRTGCRDCVRLAEETFVMEQDNTGFMWNIKKQVLSQINPDIVTASEFMKRYIEQSPLTQHFDKVHVIPFGIKQEKYSLALKKLKKQKYKISSDAKVIGFRADDYFIKGCKYFYEALRRMEKNSDIIVMSVGNGEIPKDIYEKYKVIELGWLCDEEEIIDFLEAVDIFVMPSLAEGFGVMSIEAMAAGCAVVCFKSTTIEEITSAPECGVAADYKSSGGLAKAIQNLIDNWAETQRRGRLGHEMVKERYQFRNYVEKHIRLYEKVYDRCYKERR